MTTETPKNIYVKDKDLGIRAIVINRPKALNALNTETLMELRTALEEASRDESVRVVVLTGEGEKAFIAGADIGEMKDKSPAEAVEFARLGQEVTRLLQLMPKPTIAAVNGYALGGGTEMAIACDFILASDNAVFGQPEVALGIIPGFGATVRLAHFVGMPMAKELIFSGRRIKADEALRIGLANRVVPLSELQAVVEKTAVEIASQSAIAVAHCKALMNDFQETIGLDQKLDAEAQKFGGLFSDVSDQREGMAAFVEKRKPQFKGLS